MSSRGGFSAYSQQEFSCPVFVTLWEREHSPLFVLTSCHWKQNIWQSLWPHLSAVSLMRECLDLMFISPYPHKPHPLCSTNTYALNMMLSFSVASQHVFTTLIGYFILSGAYSIMWQVVVVVVVNKFAKVWRMELYCREEALILRWNVGHRILALLWAESYLSCDWEGTRERSGTQQGQSKNYSTSVSACMLCSSNVNECNFLYFPVCSEWLDNWGQHCEDGQTIM